METFHELVLSIDPLIDLTGIESIAKIGKINKNIMNLLL
jgi:hypothetical protein